MGEYARRRSDGAEIKIGTCEDMYYLRAEQRSLVSKLPNSMDPNTADAHGCRFRFPWPDEDTVKPGEFDQYDRTMPVPNYAPVDVHHDSVQFVAQGGGYNVSLPCPESRPRVWVEVEGNEGEASAPVLLTVHRNGGRGGVVLAQQKLLADGRLVPVCRCGVCGNAWRLEEPAEIEGLAVAFRTEGDRLPNDARQFHAIADRILAGAGLTGGRVSRAATATRAALTICRR